MVYVTLIPFYCKLYKHLYCDVLYMGKKSGENNNKNVTSNNSQIVHNNTAQNDDIMDVKPDNKLILKLIPPDSTIVPTDVYNLLTVENQQLRIRISTLTQQNESLIESLHARDITIEELKKENAALKLQIENLTSRVQHLEDCVKKSQEKEYFGKLVIAIRYLDKLLSISRSADKGVAKSLGELRDYRNDGAHYFDNFYDGHESYVLTRKSALRDKINGMPDRVSRLFDRKYPGVIAEVIGYLGDEPYVGDLDTDEWWDSFF